MTRYNDTINRFLELINILLTIDDKSNFYWNFYVGTNTLIIGWMLTYGYKLNIWPRIIGATGYLLFGVFNYIALNDNYNLYDNIIDTIKRTSNSIKGFYLAGQIANNQLILLTNRDIKMKIHLLGMIIIVSIIIIYGNPFKQE